MNKIFHAIIYVLVCGVMLSHTTAPISFYDLKLQDIEDKAINMASFKGKKVLVMLVSGAAADSAAIRELYAFSKMYAVNVLIVPSLESGYKSDFKAFLKTTVGQSSKNLFITKAAYTKKASLADQSALLYWLTHKEQNTHFDYDATAAGQKFFIDESGELFSILDAKQSLTGKVVQRIMGRSKTGFPSEKAK
jgi:glutathione peroxidase